MRNVLFVRTITHKKTGEEINVDFVNTLTYIETMELDAPKLIVILSDSFTLLKDILQVAEFDEIEFVFSDEWSGTAGMNFTDTFTVLTIKNDGNFVRLELIASSVYALKTLATRTRLFTSRGIPEIISVYAGSLQQNINTFPIVSDYHCIAGERPSRLLRQIREEHGAQMWIARNIFNMTTLARLMSQTPAFEYHYNKENEYTITKYSVPSRQKRLEDTNIRSFTGWNPLLGRVKSSSSIVQKTVAPVQQSALNTYVLSNKHIAMKEVIDFICLGNGSLTAGMLLKLIWHKPSLDSPINEGLPEKIIIKSVSHWFQSQKYYCRVIGAVQLEQA